MNSKALLPQPYRQVLAHRDIRVLLSVCLLARLPIAASPFVLMLYVVLNLHRGFTASGLLAAVLAIGTGLGAVLSGRCLDRYPLRAVLVVTTVAGAAFWAAVPWLSYSTLVVVSFLGGLLSLPVYTIARQGVAASLPVPDRQAGFSLDSMAVEVSFAVGPALGVVLLTQQGPRAAFLTAAALTALSGAALIAVNPTVRTDSAALLTEQPAESGWLSGKVAAVLLATGAATVTMAGTDAGITAAVRSFHQVGLVGVVFALWCVASLVGGFVYGGQSRRVASPYLLMVMAALTLPIGLAGSTWALALAVLPAGVLCAPLITATADELTRYTPPAVRGRAMGLHSSALTVGNAAGAAVTGVLIDRVSLPLVFLCLGTMGLALAVVAARAHHRATAQPPRGSRTAAATSW